MSRRPVLNVVDRQTLFRIAAETNADPRTIRAYLAGNRRTSAAVAHSIDSACERLGILSKAVRA